MDRAAEALLSGTLSSLWAGSVATLGVICLIRWVHPGPSARYRLWIGALGVTMGAFFVGGSPRSAPDFSSPGAPPSQVEWKVGGSASDPPSAPSVPLGEESPIPAAGSLYPIGPPNASLRLGLSWGRAMLWAWLTGAAYLVAILVLELSRLASLKRATSSPDADLDPVWRKALAARPVRRRIRFLLTSHCSLPLACGYFRPAIIAPEALCRALNPDEMHQLLLHELSHLTRYDDWGLLGQRIALILCWWNPLIWFINRRLDAERELACDDLASLDSGRRAYARTLLRVAELTRGTGIRLAPGALRGNLTRRIESLLTLSVQTSTSSVSARGAAVTALGVGLAFLVSPPGVWLVGSSPPSLIPAAHHSPEMANHLDSVISRYADSGFSGSILVAVGDQITLSRGYGMADRGRAIQATEETPFSVAGFTKMFTAAAVLVLEEEGKLRVTDSIKRFFGELPGTAGAVTLHQLLTHTDGLTRQGAPIYRANREAFIRAMAAAPDSFAPGQGYRYNDFGHSMLAVIIERVSGQSYESFIRERFLEPAGMRATRFEDDPGVPFAIEYAGPANRQYPIPPRAYTWGRRGSLGMVSTVGDMYRWLRAMNNPRVMSPRVRDRMFQSHGPTTWGAERGYGWDLVRRRDGSSLWRRVAGTPGMEGELLFDPQRNWTAVILVNSRVEWRFRIWDEIWNTLTTGGAPPA